MTSHDQSHHRRTLARRLAWSIWIGTGLVHLGLAAPTHIRARMRPHLPVVAGAPMPGVDLAIAADRALTHVPRTSAPVYIAVPPGTPDAVQLYVTYQLRDLRYPQPILVGAADTHDAIQPPTEVRWLVLPVPPTTSGDARRWTLRGRTDRFLVLERP